MENFERKHIETAGAIPLLFEKGEWKVFLIQNLGYEDYWSCPKGHVETNETHEMAARRELKEETNLDVKRFIQSSPFLEEFTFIYNGKPILKRILFFMVEVEGEVLLQKKEISGGKWFTLAQAIEITKHPEGKKTLSQVEEILKKRH